MNHRCYPVLLKYNTGDFKLTSFFIAKYTSSIEFQVGLPCSLLNKIKIFNIFLQNKLDGWILMFSDYKGSTFTHKSILQTSFIQIMSSTLFKCSWNDVNFRSIWINIECLPYARLPFHSELNHHTVFSACSMWLNVWKGILIFKFFLLEFIIVYCNPVNCAFKFLE